MGELTQTELFFNKVYFPINTPVQAYTIINGGHVVLPGNDAVILAQPIRTISGEAITAINLVTITQGNQTPNILASVDRTKIDEFRKLLGSNYCYTASSYRDVKNKQKWCELYELKTRGFSYWKKGENKAQAWRNSVYCQGKCRLALPLSVMTVDHQKSQTGGEYQAIARVFRGLGLTVGGPQGGKNQAALKEFAQKVGGNHNLAPSANANERNTLSFLGSLYYSLFVTVKDDKTLKENCMHHYLNLRPMCGPCNSSRGNRSTIEYLDNS